MPSPLLGFCGFLIATLGALCGIGGGLFTTPLAHFGFRFPLRRAVAVSLAVVATGTITASVTESLHKDGAIYWNIVLLLAGCALVGNQVGFYLVSRIPVHLLKGAFTLILLFVGFRVVFGGSLPAEPEAAQLVSADYIKLVLLGLFAGILVPLLGIGGGLVMVPGLLFLTPQLGYLGARATSMAVAAIIATRSLALYARRGELETRTAMWLALGALIGAVVGVELVHAPGVAEAAQILMGTILIATAVRFALDLRSSGVARDQASD